MELLNTFHIAVINLMLNQLINARTILKLHKVLCVEFNFILLLDRFKDKCDEKMIKKSISTLDFLIEKLRVDSDIADFSLVARFIFPVAWFGHAKWDFEITGVLFFQQFMQFTLADVFWCWNFVGVADINEEFLLAAGFICLDTNACNEKNNYILSVFTYF